jgi:hypothetical protein
VFFKHLSGDPEAFKALRNAAIDANDVNDGKLYVTVGDESKSGSVQSLKTLTGKVLRLNDDGSIPQDNPFLSETEGFMGAIWSVGFRNSFTTAIDPESGRIFALDVGKQKWEVLSFHRSSAIPYIPPSHLEILLLH